MSERPVSDEFLEFMENHFLPLTSYQQLAVVSNLLLYITKGDEKEAMRGFEKIVEMLKRSEEQE